MTTTFILLQDAAPAGGGYSSIIMIVLLIAVFYFFMIRPQSQKQKKINAFRSGLKRGDKVMTAGGIHGRIHEIKDKIVMLEVDKNVTLRVDINSIYASAEDAQEAADTDK